MWRAVCRDRMGLPNGLGRKKNLVFFSSPPQRNITCTGGCLRKSSFRVRNPVGPVCVVGGRTVYNNACRYIDQPRTPRAAQSKINVPIIGAFFSAAGCQVGERTREKKWAKWNSHKTCLRYDHDNNNNNNNILYCVCVCVDVVYNCVT